ncbi:MAG TPA: prepilin peptidase [Ktedonobacterales bacterium]|nr:prepilin peptidase [Ktedonobacterales bacterium]
MLLTTQTTGESNMLAVLGVAASLASGVVGGVLVNLLADLLPREEWQWRLGSCPKCDRSLPAWRYLPVIGFLLLRGRCPQCGERLPRRHLWVDLAAPGALLLMLWRVATYRPVTLPTGALFALYGLVALVLLLIFVIDFEHHLILDIVTYPSIAALLALGLLLDHRVLFFMLVGAALAGGLFGCLYLAAYLIYHTDALGLGDVKLAVLVGLVIGWPQIIPALFYGCLVGAAVGMLLLMARKADRQTMIPLGTGLSLGAFLALFLAPLLW